MNYHSLFGFFFVFFLGFFFFVFFSFVFHLLLQDTCIFEVCFMVSVAFFSEVNVLLFL